MKIFLLNRGSSSIKCFLYEFMHQIPSSTQPLWEAQVQWKNTFDQPTLSICNAQGKQHTETLQTTHVAQALQEIMHRLVRGKITALRSLEEIDVLGHRIVHGGKEFHCSVRVTPEVKEKIRMLTKFAPLHNLPELEGIELLEQLCVGKPQIAMFDTAFHHTLPMPALMYPGPYRWYEEGIRRYGFHGISYQYCSRRAAEVLHCEQKKLNMVICHLGSGASLCAIKEGKSIDTTMGFTPLEGLMMDTRAGSIDPGILLYFMNKKNVQEITKELYHDSGLLGVSGLSSDMRDIIQKSEEGHPRSLLAFEVYLHRLSALIGSMIASLQGMDALVFTAGIGENAVLLRNKICERFAFLGLKLDLEKNKKVFQKDEVISSGDSKIQVLVIHTQEAFEMARECWHMISEVGLYDSS